MHDRSTYLPPLLFNSVVVVVQGGGAVVYRNSLQAVVLGWNRA